MVTENKILNNFDKTIGAIEKKYSDDTRKDLEQMFKSLENVLSDRIVRVMFFEYLSITYPEERGIILLLNLYGSFKACITGNDLNEAFEFSKIIYEALSTVYNDYKNRRNNLGDFEG